MSNAVNKPAHYNQGSIECIDAMKIVLTPEEFRGYLKGNVFKYLWREKDKNGNEDLRKGKDYYDRLIQSFDESEDQPVIKQSSTTEPDPGEGYRLLSKDPPEKLLDTDEGLFACGLDGQQWLSVNYSSGEQLPSVYYRRKIEPAKAPLNSDTIPEGYRKLNDSSEEPRQLGDLRWSVAAKRYVEISVDEIGYANRDNWAACRKITGEVTGKVKPPDGWRWIKVGETLRRGDTTNTIDEIPETCIDTKCVVKHFALRRNKFEVGEKVVHINGIHACVVVECDHEKDQYVIVYNGRKYVYESKCLVPYIEEAK